MRPQQEGRDGSGVLSMLANVAPSSSFHLELVISSLRRVLRGLGPWEFVRNMWLHVCGMLGTPLSGRT